MRHIPGIAVAVFLLGVSSPIGIRAEPVDADSEIRAPEPLPPQDDSDSELPSLDDPPPPVGVPVLRETTEKKAPVLSKDGTHVDGKSVAEWIKQSQTGKAQERKAAFSALFVLGRKNNKEAVRGLVAGLSDPDAGVSDYVYLQLEIYLLSGHKELAPVFAGGLEATQPLKVRRRVACLLAKLSARPQMTAAIPALCAALKDEDALVRVKTAAALWQWDPNAADLVPIFLDGFEDPNSEVKRTAFNGLEMMGPSAATAASVLGEKMRNDDAETGPAKRLLIGIGKAAVPTLILGLGSESKTVRAQTALALERIGSDAADAVPALHGALRDENLEVRLSAAEALWRIEGKPGAVVSVFLDAYQHGDRKMRNRCIWFLKYAWPKSPEALAGYLSAFKDPDCEVRRTAVHAQVEPVLPLANELIRALVDSLKDEDEEVVNYSRQRLSRMGPAALPYLLPVCREQGPPRVRAMAISLLASEEEHQDEVAELCLRALREDAAWLVRYAAAIKLRECDKANKKALAELLLAFQDIDPDVRTQVAEILSSFETDEDVIVAALIQGLHDPASIVRSRAATGLGKLRRNPHETVPALIGVLRDSNESVQRAAGIALGQLGPEAKAAIPHLGARLTDVSSLRSRRFGGKCDEEPEEWAARALSNIGVEAAPALGEALTHEKARVRFQAALALERIGPEAKAAIPQLKKLLSDPATGVRTQAMDALKAIDPELAKKLLVS
jgi:HEAT repeat protein